MGNEGAMQLNEMIMLSRREQVVSEFDRVCVVIWP